MADKSAALFDIEQRKESLLHGPEEFRKIRSDQNSNKPRFRKSAEQRLSEATEGMAAYREVEAAKHANMQRLRSERLSREASNDREMTSWKASCREIERKAN